MSITVSAKIESLTGDEVVKRFPIKLPPWHEKRLIWWAAMKGTSKTGLAQNTLQARIEANEQLIEAMLIERATDLGISIDELKTKLLEQAGFSPPKAGEEEED